MSLFDAYSTPFYASPESQERQPVYPGLRIKNHEDESKIILTGQYRDKPDVTFHITVTRYDFVSWRAGKLIQDCFPYLSAGERETLISGYSDEGFNEMFRELDDDIV